MCSISSRNIGTACKAGTDSEECRIKAAPRHFRCEVVNLTGKLKLHAQLGNSRDLLVENCARKSILRDAVAHHAAGRIRAISNADFVPHASKMIGCGQTGRACAHDKDTFSAFRRGLRERPAFFKRMITQKALYGVDADGFIKFTAIAGGLACVIAHAPHAGRKRIILDNLLPSLAIITALCVIKPSLALLAGRTLGVARRKTVHIDRTQRAPASGAVGQRRADIKRNGKRFAAH